MKIKLSELKKMIQESIKSIKEDDAESTWVDPEETTRGRAVAQAQFKNASNEALKTTYAKHIIEQEEIFDKTTKLKEEIAQLEKRYDFIQGIIEVTGEIMDARKVRRPSEHEVHDPSNLSKGMPWGR